jgi:hypothetical protein
MLNREQHVQFVWQTMILQPTSQMCTQALLTVLQLALHQVMQRITQLCSMHSLMYNYGTIVVLALQGLNSLLFFAVGLLRHPREGLR